MESTLISKVKFNLRTIQFRIGNLGVLGLMMLISAVLLYFGLIFPQTRQLHSAEKIYNKLSSQHAWSAKQQTPQQSLSAKTFLRNLPNIAQKDESLKTIIAIAEKNTLPLDAGKYEVLTKESGQVVFYQISFPLKGTYPQIKQFLATTLNTLPNAALSQILFHHASVESNQAEADVVFILYFTKAR